MQQLSEINDLRKRYHSVGLVDKDNPLGVIELIRVMTSDDIVARVGPREILRRIAALTEIALDALSCNGNSGGVAQEPKMMSPG